MTRRVVIQGGAAAAMRVSQPGYDVLTADSVNMIFDSRYAGLRFFDRGITAIPEAVGQNDVTYNWLSTPPSPPLILYYFAMGNTFNSVGGNVSNYWLKGGSAGEFWLRVISNTVSVRFARRYATLSTVNVYWAAFVRPLQP